MSGLSLMPTFTAIIKYNLKVVFSGKFIWFLIASTLLYIFFIWNGVYRGERINEQLIYSSMLYPAILLIFYPCTFGIQNDYDNRILEILFGIPNYRYKIWLLRMLMIYIASFFMMLILALVSYVLIYANNPLEIAAQIMIPVIFFGNLAFFISTITHNGSGTAILIIVIGIVSFFSIQIFNMSNKSPWDIFLNPYFSDDYSNPLVWSITVTKNRVYMGFAIVITMMLGLLNLQNREGFMK